MLRQLYKLSWFTCHRRSTGKKLQVNTQHDTGECMVHDAPDSQANFRCTVL